MTAEHTDGAENARPRRVCVAQIGARRRYAVPETLLAAGMLESFHTDILGQGPLIETLAASLRALRGARRLRGRVVSPELARRTLEHRRVGLEYALRRALRIAPRRHTYLWAGRRFATEVARRGFGEADLFYGFTEGSLEALQAAREAGMTTVLDQFITAQPVRDRILREELERFPDWQNTTLSPVAPEAYDRVRAEWALSDLIICPSDTVRQSLVEMSVPAERLRVVPHGTLLGAKKDAGEGRRERTDGGGLRVLFVGSVELRKGIQYLHQALAQLSDPSIEVRIAGPVRLRDEKAAEIGRHAELLGQVPHADIDRHFAWADLLVLPSLVEGAAMVTFEALSRGLPVICTREAGSVVRDGETGIIVPARDAEALASALAALAASPERLDALKAGARAAIHDASAERYRADLVAALESAPGARTHPGGVAA